MEQNDIVPVSRAELYDAFLLHSDQVPAICRFVQQRSVGPRWLDAGCGTGRPAGSVGTGLRCCGNRSRHRLRDPGAGSGTGCCIICGALQELRQLELNDLDGIVVCNGPLGYILDDSELAEPSWPWWLRCVPGGVLITDTWYPWILDHYEPPAVQRAQIRGFEVERRSRHEIDRSLQRFTHVDVITVSQGEGRQVQREERFPFAMRSSSFLLEAHQAAGLQALEAWQGWDADAPSDTVDGPRVLLTESADWTELFGDSGRFSRRRIVHIGGLSRSNGEDAKVQAVAGVTRSGIGLTLMQLGGTKEQDTSGV